MEMCIRDRISRDVKVFNIEKLEDVEKVVEQLK